MTCHLIDPSMFTPEAINPEVSSFNQRLEQVLNQSPRLDRVPVKETRDARRRGVSLTGEVIPIYESPLASNRTIAGNAGEIPLRVFTPERIEGVYLHIHGGGWALGGNHYQDEWLEQIAREAHLAVVSVEYRLAPEHPYPAGPDDCETAASWLVENAVQEFGVDRLLIGGESAGAHLAAVTCVRMRERHGYTGFCGAVLTYGAYDFSMPPSLANWGSRDLIISTPTMAWLYDMFVPDASMRRQPDISPLYADLSEFPPSLLTVGTLDPLLDDSLFLHTKLLSVGCASELAVYPGGVHGFDVCATPLLTEQARARIKSFLRQGSV